MLNVIDSNKIATGVVYQTNEQKFHTHHEQYNQECVWLDRSLEEGEQLSEQEYDDTIASNARMYRDNLLRETDWVVTKAKETQSTIPAAYKTYRQALRDITEQTGFPHDISWPVLQK